VKFKEKAMMKLLKNVRAPKDKTVQAARYALQNEAGFKALTLEQQEGTLRIFDEEWSKLKGDTIRGSDVIEIPKRIHVRVQTEVLVTDSNNTEYIDTKRQNKW